MRKSMHVVVIKISACQVMKFMLICPGTLHMF